MTFNTLIKSFQLLDIFAQEKTYLSVGTISSALKMPRSTTYKYLAVLKEHGILTYDNDSAAYGLGSKLIELGAVAQALFPLEKIALPFMNKLSNETEETVALVMVIDHNAYLLKTVESKRRIVLGLRERYAVPLYCGAAQKTLLAFMPDEEIENYLKNTKFIKFTEFTLTDPKNIFKELIKIRKSGFAFSNQETDLGARGLAAPIFKSNNEIIASISIIVPIHRMDTSKTDIFRDQVIKYAKLISKELKRRRY